MQKNNLYTIVYKMQPQKIVAFALIVLLLFPLSTQACTGVMLTANDGSIIQARTIEWGEYDLNSKLIISPRNVSYTTMLNDGTKGLTWKNKYAFVGISVAADQYIGEGTNEKGLNAGIFYFRGFGSLEELTRKNRKKALTDIDFVRWILSNFASIDEMLEEFEDITLVPVMIFPDGTPAPTGHWRVSDSSGRNIVIEIMNNGEVEIHENIVGVLTNSPAFPWQVTNLSNYLNIEPGTITSKNFGDYTANTFGTGTASLGLPGDITSPSRFIRAVFYKSTAPKADNAVDAVAQAFHILNNFDIPIGVEFAEGEERKHMPDIPSATQWTAVSDLTSKLYYYKTMYNSTVRCVDIVEITSKYTSEQQLPLDEPTFYYEKY